MESLKLPAFLVTIAVPAFLQASVRVMPGCFLLGQAAGIAAALAAAKRDVRMVSVAELQGKIIASGGYLPNFR